MAGFWIVFSSVIVCGVVQGEIQKNCRLSWEEYEVSSQRNEVWSSRLYDSSAKIPSGLFDGNLKVLGNYDECVGVRAQKVFDGKDVRIFGKYCLVDGKINNIEKLKDANLKLGFCIPNYCSADDMNQIIETNNFPLAPKIKSDNDISLKFTENFCQSEFEPVKLRPGDYAAIAFYMLIVLLLVVSTIYDVILYYHKKEPHYKALIAFSALSNGRKLCSISHGKNQLTCLHGIRAISMMWIILGHSYSTTSLGAITNSFAIINWYKNPFSMYMLGATVAVDSFFLLSGIVLSYTFLRDRTRGHWIVKILVSYLHRYIRLTPALAAVLIVHVTILKYMGQGPFWPISENYLINNCNKYWWSVLLYLQNYVNGNEQCVGQAWYLSVDMQLFILSPIVLFPLKKYPKYTLASLVLLICASIAGTFYIVWHYRLSGLLSGQDLLSIRVYYIVTHTRAPPYLIGLIIGYFIYKAKVSTNIVMNKSIVTILWIASLIVLFTCVFAGQNLITDQLVEHTYNRGANVAYMSFMRPSWAIGLAWVIYACVTGYGGPINAFLSLNIFQILSKFTYTLFLVHYTILSVLVLSQKEPISFSDRSMMFQFWSNYVLALVFAIGLTLTFESPIIVLEKSLKCRREPEVVYDVTDETNYGYSTYSIPRVQIDSIYSQVLKNAHSV